MLEVKNIEKSFEKESVLEQVNFQLEENQVLSVLGRSGSGKTTLLKIIAGLERESGGEIIWKGQTLNDLPPNARKIVYLYQEALLFPHLNVFENVAFGLRLKHENEKVVKEKVGAMLEALGLGEHENKMTHQLSGGQKQRVSFGRALVISPPVLLLDEPFGALDGETRKQMQDLFFKMKEQFNMTALFVTHDIKEAIIIGDKLGHMQNGRIKLYEDLAQFLLDPATEAQRELKFWEGVKADLDNYPSKDS
ncbi:MAG: ABC transporter ATP-binding protein [Bacteroidota bacterium]